MEARLRILLALLGAALILIVLWDAFETVVFPRRVTRRARLTRLFYRSTWRPWSAIVCRIASGKRQDTWLSYFGPISLLFLLTLWAGVLILGFALLLYGDDSAVDVAGGAAGFATDLYMSGTTFFTLGLGDVTARTPLGRLVTVVEAGLGFGFLALVIGYLPALNQSFSRREVNISLLDSRAGSPPTGFEILRRHSHDGGMEELRQLLQEWERWSAELLESHLSYPVLAYFRSQHDNQSWLAALTAILDASALTMASLEGVCERQARLTFAIARHAVADLAHIFGTDPLAPARDRLPSEDLESLRRGLEAAGLRMRSGEATVDRLAEYRQMYEPYVHALSRYLRIDLPPWISDAGRTDNWQTSAWGTVSRVAGNARFDTLDDDHF
jgi:hypothetical protein